MSTLPAFSKDIRGEYFGGAFWDSDDYRVHIVALDGTGTQFLLTVETSDGGEVGQTELSRDEVDGILKMASTDHDISGYEDDWTFPAGMVRVLTWTLQTDINHTVVLNEADIDEVAAWFRYAIGEDEWTGGSEWSEWEY